MADNAPAAPSRAAQAPAGAPLAGQFGCPVPDTPPVTRARGASTISIAGSGYVYSYTERNSLRHVVDSFTVQGNFSDTTFHLLDDDAEDVLESAGIGPGILGSRFAMMTMFEVGTSDLKSIPSVDLLLGQQVSELADLAGDDLECAMKAIRAHSVAQVTTDANARARITGVAPGTYYLYGRYFRVSNPAPSGGLYWNLKVEVKPGQNVVRISPENAAWQQSR